MKKKARTPKKTLPPPRESEKQRKLRAARLYRGLVRLYPDAHCELDYRDPFELLMATILSAQCTDVRVNMVTPRLFETYPGPDELGAADPATVEAIIRTTGFYRNKAKSLVSASRDIAEIHGGKVPATMDELLRLRGVARKTANVVLGNAYDLNEGVVVDTHVNRLANRMGLTGNQNPVQIEKNLMALFPRKNWCQLSHLLIWHGRRECRARKPDCAGCRLRSDCPRIGLPDLNH
jgi:endonuclease-3